ncbi:Flp pilus assembly protein CpaB [Arthrobacter sp. Marseille-P9274]|uniref:Flp pilus assembly protein CpaB n=1 Tax=Arthrobacter sp. Marseille-P9274 TaxID=2866572 RepID=UPI0021C7BD00|nr:SAF domain-containing protein [Arthrobacter sp. Marseille-P9274]
MADMQPASVLLVKTAVPAGTPAEALNASVASTSLPASAIAPTALTDLSQSAGKVTAVDLVPGEQLLTERLVAPEEVQAAGAVDVPKGLQEVSFQLEPQRVVGGRLVAGEHVGVFISMDKGGIESSPEKETTQLVVRKALLTAIQRAPQPVTEEGEADSQALPEGSMLVTVAVDDKAAQKIVFAAEFAKIWLSKEPKDAKESKPTVVQRSEVYR